MFKKLLSLLFLMWLVLALPITARSATYYVSSSSGDDANDGTSEATPWQTIDKANSVILDENSSLLFKRGEVFRGAINTNKFRTGMTFGAYGTGDRPIIAGSVEITGWTKTTHSALGSKVYEADVSAFITPNSKGIENQIQHLFVNGELMTIARYPNVDSPADKNWLNVDAGAGAGTDAFTDQALVAYGKPGGYWKGATLRIRTYSWYYKVFEVTGYAASNGKITAAGLGGGGGFPLEEWGYFLDGKLEELDHPGEWYYDADAKKVYFYAKNGVNPNTLLVEGSTYGTGVNVYWHEDNSTVENLTFRHFTTVGVNINNSDNVIVRNCHFEYNTKGVSVYQGADALITGNTFSDQLSVAIGLSGASDFDVKSSTIEKNQITNVGMFPLYCNRYEGTCYGIGISVAGKGFTVRQNTVENTGWNGIYLKGDGHHLVENNVVRKALSLINDGGAISLQSSDNIIRGNFLLDTIGNVDESNGCATTNQTPCSRHSSYGMGIGVDLSNLKNTVIEGNTIANNADVGIRLRGYINTSVRDNVLFNNDPQIRMEIKDTASHSNVVDGNLVYSLKPDQIGVELKGETNYGTFNNNFYCNPYNEVAFIRADKRYALAHWKKTFSSYDKTSKWCDFHHDEYSVSNVGANLILNSTFDADISGWGKIFDANKAEMDGGSLKAVHPGTGNLNVIPNAFDLVENQLYRLKFSVIGNGFGNIRLRINNTESGTDTLEERYFAYDTNRKDYELFFPSPVTTSAGKMLFTTQDYDADTFWLDNVTFEPVTATLNDATQKSVLFTNTTENPKTISLGGKTYLDLDGNTVTGSITLAAFSSQILIFTGNAPPSQVTLTINKPGTGTGKVSSQPAGINCGADCEQSYTSGTAITLTATPDAGSTFAGWSGTNCSGSFTITADMNCAATFNKVVTPTYTLTLQKAGLGSGQVSSQPAGIDCGADCDQSYTSGTALILTATPDSGSTFAGFSGDANCSNSFTITADMNCTATFNKEVVTPTTYTLNIQKAGTGNGQVSSQPTGISCGADCEQSYSSGTALTLTPTPNSGSTFAGFSGDAKCSNSFTITADMNCTATFNKEVVTPTTYTLNIQKAGTGNGQVSSQPTGISCGADCEQSYSSGTALTLTPTPNSGSTFAGFSGDAKCSNSFTITADMDCTATFNKIVVTPSNYTLTIENAGTGSGQVTSQPAGIDCGSDCTDSYQSDTAIILTATPDSGSTFAGFSGDANCAESFTLTADMDCTATFNKIVVTPPNYTLTIQNAGTGSGQVTSQPAGIDCGSDCTDSYQGNTAITLTATPDSGSTFAGFSGDANCAESFTLTADMDCTATFNKIVVTPPNYTLTLQNAGTGSGQVTSQPAGIDCGSDCTDSYQGNTAITLTATPDSGSTFAGFSGDANCAESFTLTADMDCTATFNKIVVTPSNYTLTIQNAGTGSGQVTSQPAGIDCGSDCTDSYQSDTAIILTATPDSGSTFAGFSGDANCAESFTLTADMDCTATFNKIVVTPPNYTLTLQNAGTGSGQVTSQPAGIDCGSDCTDSYQGNTAITLTATPDSGSTFAGFSGDANCAESFTLTADMDCTATFNKIVVTPSNYTLTIQNAGTGSGQVTSQPAGIDCGSDCTDSYQGNTAITLTATPDSGSTFAGFSGDANCAESFTLTADMDCTATFDLLPPPPSYTLTIQTDGMGTGKVTSDSTGINCGTDCTATYQSGTAVTLTATPATESTFLEWMGDCSGFDMFTTVTMDAGKNCIAHFDFVAFTNAPTTPNCLNSGLVNGVCNAVGQAQKDVTISTEGHVSNIVLKGITTNKGWLSNAVIEPQATLRGGIVTGYITNNGLMSDFEFRGASVTGGTLSGVITNTRGGTIKEVHLKANTRLSGGKLAGKITGEESNETPAWLENIEVQAESELSGVVLSDNVQLLEDVKLGKGVRFTNNQLIPQDLELADLLPSLSESLACAENVTQPAPVDLSTEVLWKSESILKAINQLPAFKDNGWEVTQEGFSGLQLTVDVLHFAVQPLSVKPTTDSALMQVQDTQSARFITDTGRDILTQPAVQAPCDLQTALAGFDLPQFVVQPNGNLKIPAKDDNWYSARADFSSIEVAQNTARGMFFNYSPLVSDVFVAYLVFTDAHGTQREQMFYPALAFPEALSASAQQVVIRFDGFVSFKQKGQTFSGVVDYLITQSTPPTTTNDEVQVKSQPDMNGDGIADLVLLYPTGEQQILFAVPGDK